MVSQKQFINDSDDLLSIRTFDNLDLPTLVFLYFDFEKALDKVSHKKLLEKLEECGFEGGVIHFFRAIYKDGYREENQTNYHLRLK